ncbi:hypothetical protein EB796_021103 [Bugula neritina]|uniref:Uncharacterized protein n=1 Tax=Bugula neritina TaxID=10212 RepID=A0A7J7J327_BUGNE|nr:hypothetical protein EB796_021103 [Bugula neritina]
MAIVKPCGIIIDHREMYTCESTSQLFPFVERLHENGNAGAAELSKLKYLVDIFHIRGHTKAECDISQASCKSHLDLPIFTEISAANTECAEQTFSWLKKYKHTVKYMTAAKFRFFLCSIIEDRNTEIHQQQKGEFL